MSNINVIKFPDQSNLIGSTFDQFDFVLSLIADDQYVKAKDILVELVDGGVNEAFEFLGCIYALNPDRNPILDYNTSYFYFEKAIETTQSVEALVGVAVLLKSGLLGYKDNEEALEIFSDIENEGIFLDGYVYFMIGNLTLFDEEDNIKDINTAELSFRKGWELGHILCLTSLGFCESLKGNWFRSIVYRLKAFPLVLFYILFDKNSPRIRH